MKGLYNEVQCIMENDHTRPLCGQTETPENIALDIYGLVTPVNYFDCVDD